MSITSFCGIADAIARAEQSVVGSGVAWHQPVARPRPYALLTLDPTQRPSAPPRWAP